MGKIIPAPNEPKTVCDGLYGELTNIPEEDLNFFANKKFDIDKTNVSEKDQATISGLENLLEQATKIVATTEDISGTEGMTFKKVVDVIIQLAKDVATYLLNLINNRLSRVDLRLFRLKNERKRQGIKNKEVKYPMGVKRLVVPLKMTIDPNWVSASLDDVLNWYKKTINGYNYLLTQVKVKNDPFDISTEIFNTLQSLSTSMGLSKDKDGWVSNTLPGNRKFVVDSIQDGDTSQIKIYFADSALDAKLSSQTFEPTGPMVDKTLDKISSIVKEIKSNQSHMSQLSRNFEKEIVSFTNKQNEKLSPAQKEYFRWLIRFNKRLMSLSIQYVISSVDSGLDFCQTGIGE